MSVEVDPFHGEEIPTSFKSPQDETSFWKAKYLKMKIEYTELEQSFDEFRVESGELESHLESELERSETNISELSSKLLSLQERANESQTTFREKIRESSMEVDKFQQELIKAEGLLEETRKKNRKLEQENDDLERHKREAEAVVESLKEERDQILEQKICLQVEFDDLKVKNEETIQRLRQEVLELTSEVQVKNIQMREIKSSDEIKKQPSPSEPPSQPNELVKEEEPTPAPAPTPTPTPTPISKEEKRETTTAKQEKEKEEEEEESPFDAFLVPARTHLVSLMDEIAGIVGDLEEKMFDD